jgi:hypothetical protein
MTLYMRSTQSCLGGPYSPPNKQSEGAKITLVDLHMKVREGEGVPRRLDMDWETDLGLDRGGIDGGEFGKWLEERKKAMGWSEPKTKAF